MSEISRREMALAELMASSEFIVLAEKSDPHLRSHPVPVTTEDVKGVNPWSASAIEAAGPVTYAPFTRVLKTFTVKEILKAAPQNDAIAMEPGSEILVAEPMDSVAFTEHLCEELDRVHGIEFYESPVVGSYDSAVTDYDGEDALVLFLSTGVRRVSDEEELAPGLEEGEGGHTLVVDGAWEGPARVPEIREILESDPEAGLPPLM